MSKDLFSPVNYDEAFPTPEAVVAPVVPEEPMTVERAIALINAELAKVPLGTSKMVPHAIQINPKSTPFLITLNTFQSDPTVDQATALVNLAAQDFGTTFSRFVSSTVAPLFKKGK